MSKDITEYLDDYCYEVYGHKDWFFIDTEPKWVIDKLIKSGTIELHNHNIGIYIKDRKGVRYGNN